MFARKLKNNKHKKFVQSFNNKDNAWTFHGKKFEIYKIHARVSLNNFIPQSTGFSSRNCKNDF